MTICVFNAIFIHPTTSPVWKYTEYNKVRSLLCYTVSSSVGESTFFVADELSNEQVVFPSNVVALQG